jgi:hypothetical protein
MATVTPPSSGDSGADLLDHGEEWEAEIDRRMEDVRSGRVELIPAEQVFAELDAKLDERRQARTSSGRLPGARSNGGR